MSRQASIRSAPETGAPAERPERDDVSWVPFDRPAPLASIERHAQAFSRALNLDLWRDRFVFHPAHHHAASAPRAAATELVSTPAV